MDELMDKYKDKFGECFPLMLTRGMSDEERMEEIKNCIKNNKPYSIDNEYDY